MPTRVWKRGGWVAAARAAMLCGLLLCAAAHAQGAGGERIAWLWDGARAPAWADGRVALVVRHVLLRGDEVWLRPRASTPELPAHAKVTPVVHVQLSGVKPPRELARAHGKIVEAMLQAGALSRSGWVQLDLEAVPSQRAAYLELVKDIRGQLPANLRLSVTALAWWCRDARWLDTLAADEVVPMFFRMGREGGRMRAIVAQKPARLHPRCGAAAGFSVQEPFEAAVAARYARTYWFDDRRWKDGAVSEERMR